jgi:hypothetical protein
LLIDGVCGVEVVFGLGQLHLLDTIGEQKGNSLAGKHIRHWLNLLLGNKVGAAPVLPARAAAPFTVGAGRGPDRLEPAQRRVDGRRQWLVVSKRWDPAD